MKIKILIFITVLSVVFSLLVIPSFADESESLVSGNYYFLEYSPDSDVVFPITAGGYSPSTPFGFIAISKDNSVVYNCDSVSYYAQPGQLKIRYKGIVDNEYADIESSITASDFYFGVRYNLADVNRISLDRVFNVVSSPFQLLPSPGVTFRFRNATSMIGTDFLLSGVDGFCDYVFVSNNPMPFDSCVFGGTYINGASHSQSYFEALQKTGTDYVTVESFYPSSQRFISFESVPDSVFDALMFYLYLPYNDESYTPLPPLDSSDDPVVPDTPNTDGGVDFSDFSFVLDFVVDIFNGLDNLVIFSNKIYTVSLLDIILAYLTVFVVRFILKMIAGG